MEYSTKRAERLKQACNKDSFQKKEYGVPFPTEKYVQKPVYLVPTEILSYNFDNGRIAAEKLSLEHRRGKKLNPNSSADQKAVAEILLTSQWYKGSKATEYLKQDLATVGQTDAAIVTFDGVLLNGNRRTACLNSLFEDTGKPEYKKVEIVVLPRANEKELLDLENRLQLASDYRQEYGPINDRIRLRSLKKSGFTMKEIIHSVKGRWKESDIETKIEEINLIDEYLKAIGRHNDYDAVLKKGAESFTGLIQAINQPAGIKNSIKAKIEKQKRKLIGFGLINHPNTTYTHIRKYKAVLKNPKASKEFLGNSSIYKARSQTVIKNPKVLADELENLELAHDYVSKIKASPTPLIKAAHQKLNLISMDRIQKNDKEFKGYLTKIEKIIERISKRI